jgi:hypothetical protein
VPHVLCPLGHEPPHCPDAHTVPPVQALPQPPQLDESFWVLTQAPLQSVSAVGQLQVPLAQDCLPVHALPHRPQCRLSLVTSMQPEPQSC